MKRLLWKPVRSRQVRCWTGLAVPEVVASFILSVIRLSVRPQYVISLEVNCHWGRLQNEAMQWNITIGVYRLETSYRSQLHNILKVKEKHNSDNQNKMYGRRTLTLFKMRRDAAHKIYFFFLTGRLKKLFEMWLSVQESWDNNVKSDSSASTSCVMLSLGWEQCQHRTNPPTCLEKNLIILVF